MGNYDPPPSEQGFYLMGKQELFHGLDDNVLVLKLKLFLQFT
jgi:hypothetical protein